MHKTITLLLTISLLAFSTIANAVPARPGKIEYKQPDGQIITITLKGDEFIHWAETLDNYTVLQNKEGYYYYAVKDRNGLLVISNQIAHNPNERKSDEIYFLKSITQKLRFDESQVQEAMGKWGGQKGLEKRGGFPTIGSHNLVMILANFNNTSTTFSQTDFDNYMNQVGYSGTGSFKDYYLEVSYGQLVMTTVVTAWVTVPNTHDYYGPQAKWGEFARDAVEAADAIVDYSQFDNDGDGDVDGVAIIHQGAGQEASSNTNDIWSHSWNLASAGYTIVNDGVTVDAYTTQPEIASGGGMSTIGVMCHEFGHNLGAPDYYDTDYEANGSYSGTGQWDMMAGGSWNNSGNSPAHHNAFTKWKYYGWIAPTELTSGQQVSMLNSAENDNGFYYYTTPTTGEYWLLENRQKIGFDAYVPGHGLLIYHVDEPYVNSHDASNDINVGLHQGMYPVCATASGNPTSTYGTINSSGTPFPGTGSRTAFTDATTPASLSWASANTNKPVTNISELSNVISFDFMGGGNNPSDFVATTVSSSQINLTWDASAFEGAIIAFSTDGTFGTPVDGTTYIAGNTIPGGGLVLYKGAGSSYSHTGLAASTVYYYKIWAMEDATPTYTSGTTTIESTLCDLVTTFPYKNDFAGNALPTCWENIDNDGSGQIWEFDNPAGITFNSTTAGNGFAILDSDNYGSGNSQNADLVSPIFDFTDYTSITLSFEHYFRYYSGSSIALSYSTDGGSTWTDISSWSTASVGTETTPAVFTQDLTTELQGQANVKFKWNYTGSWGYYWCVDDIEVDAALNGTPYTVTFNVTDAGDSHPIDAASVSINSTVLTTDVSGEATIDLIDGTYSYAVNKNGYDESSGSVVVNGGNITENVSLSESSYTLTFVVEDENSQAVESASIDVNSATLTTDVNGEATLDLVNGTYSYTVSKIGFDNATGSVNITGTSVTENVTLTVPTYTVTFTVTDAGDSHALDAASISINSSTLTADLNGNATIDLADGTYAYTVTKSGYDEASGSVTVSGTAISEDVSMAETTYTLTFVVEDESNQTVENASISINSSTLATDVNGEATIDLPDGTHSYTVTKAGFADATNTVTISGVDITENVTLVLSTYTLTFNVTDAGDAHVIEGASISINSTTLTTDVDGTATIDLVDGGYPYMVSNTGYDNATGTITVSGGTVTENVAMYKSNNVLTFVVQDESATAIDGASITINSTTITTDASGEATITLPNGAFSFTITKTGYSDANGSVTMAGADVTQSVTLYANARTVTFNVTDGANPLSGASININSSVVLTDGSGTATINLPDGTYAYTVIYTGYDEVNGSVMVSGTDITENVAMNESEYTITFTVQDEDYAAVDGATISINSSTLTTDASGQATIDLLNGSYSYTITKAGLADANGSVTVANAPVSENATMYGTAHAITFNITDADGGTAIEGAAIVINNTTLLSDASGVATINLPDGDYAFNVSKDGYESDNGSVSLAGADMTENVSLNAVEAITFDFNVTDIFCYGSSDGQIEFTNVTGGSGSGYEYSVNGGASWQTSSIITGLSAGTFNALVKDAAGNVSVTQSVIITQPDQIIGFVVDTENVTTYGGNDGSISITGVTGGSGSYEYSIDGGTVYQASNLFENLVAGNYDIVVKDSYGCEVAVGAVTIVEPSQPEYPVTFEVFVDGHVYEGATIKINSVVLSTNSSGQVEFSLVHGTYDYTVTVEGFDNILGTVVVDGVAVTETINFVGITGAFANQINIYPNPVSSTLTIDLDGSYNVTLLNGIGNVIVKKAMNAKGVLEVDQYADGLYLLRIEQNGQIITKPVIIKK